MLSEADKLSTAEREAIEQQVFPFHPSFSTCPFFLYACISPSESQMRTGCIPAGGAPPPGQGPNGIDRAGGCWC